MNLKFPDNYRIRSEFKSIDWTIYPMLEECQENLVSSEINMHKKDGFGIEYDEMIIKVGFVLAKEYKLYRVYDKDNKKKYLLRAPYVPLFVEFDAHIQMIDNMFSLRNTKRMHIKSAFKKNVIDELKKSFIRIGAYHDSVWGHRR